MSNQTEFMIDSKYNKIIIYGISLKNRKILSLIAANLEKMKLKHGNKCFLEPRRMKYPICNKYNGKPECMV